MGSDRIDEAAAEIARSRARREQAAMADGSQQGGGAPVPRRLVTDEEQFAVLVSALEDYAIITLDPSGRITSWNDSAKRIKGYDEEEVIGRHFALFYPLEDIKHGKAQAELTVAREAGHFQEEGWRMRKGGERFWARITLTAIHDAAGVVKGFVKVTHDLSDRERGRAAASELSKMQALLGDAERAQADAEAAERRLLSLIGSMSDGYFTLDEHWRFSFANPALAKLLGKPGRDLVGASFWDEVTDSIHSNFFKYLPPLLTGGSQVDFTEFHEPTQRWFSVHANRTDGRIVVFLRDVTAEQHPPSTD